MKWKIYAAAALVLSISACGPGASVRAPTVPAVAQAPVSFASPVSAFPTQAVPTRITVGTDVTDTLMAHGNARFYEVTAPAEGILVVRVSWKRADGSLEMKVADSRFPTSSVDESMQIVAKVPVIAGLMYPVTVADAAPWDYDVLRLSFVVTTSME
jgi:hypothetical protein